MRVVSLAPAGFVEESGAVQFRPAVALRVMLLLLVVGNLGRIPVLDLGNRSAPLLVNDIALLSVLAIAGVAMVHRRSAQLNDVAFAGILFASIGALSAIAGIQRFGFSALEVIASLAYLARWIAYFGLYIVVINCVRAGQTEAIWSALEWAMLVIVAFGIVQAIFLPNFAFTVNPDAQAGTDWDIQRNRLVSTILEPNIAAAMILTVLLVQLARLGTGTPGPIWKPLLMLAGLVATLSRGGIGSFGIGGLVLAFVFRANRRILRFAAGVSVLLVFAAPRLISFATKYERFGVSDSSALSRVIMWQRAFETFLDYPWFGIGFNTWGFVQERRGIERLGGSAYSAEGGLLFVAVLTGIVGLTVFLGMLWLAVRRMSRHWRDARATPAERGILIGTAAATVAILIDSVFVNSLFTPFSMEPLWVLWGLAFVIASDLRSRSTAVAQ